MENRTQKIKKLRDRIKFLYLYPQASMSIIKRKEEELRKLEDEAAEIAFTEIAFNHSPKSHSITEKGDRKMACKTPGEKKRSKGKGLGLAKGKGKGPIGVPVGMKTEMTLTEAINSDITKIYKKLKDHADMQIKLADTKDRLGAKNRMRNLATWLSKQAEALKV